MTTATPATYEIDIEDVEYLHHAGKPLLARFYKPRGAGPFPLIVEVHGGAWCRHDRLEDVAINEPLAKAGVVVMALDFRMPPDAGYPASIADINYAIRWAKQRAATLKIRADRIGVMGSSSGGHQAMLAAMRPRDPRYLALPLSGPGAAVDASVRCAVLCWPVIDPLGRYEYAKRLKAEGPPASNLADRWLPNHEIYWQTEAAMAEGSPARALERGEQVELPAVFYLQGTADKAHPRPDLDRFMRSYPKAGGRVELHLYEGEGEGFILQKPGAPASLEALNKIAKFVHTELG